MLPKRFSGRVEIAAVRLRADEVEPGSSDESQTFRLAGRVLARRDLGKILFLDLVDRSGRIQLLVREKVDVDLGDIVGVSGHPAKSRRGEPSLQVTELELLAKIRVPLPDTFHGLTDVEQRYRRRYLDLLMNEDTRRSFEIRTRAVTEIRRYLDEEGFLEVETPVLQPRYGGGFATPFITHYNELDQDVYLRIATELYLKRLIVGGARTGLRDRQGLSQRRALVQELARVHDARVVRGLCELRGRDGADGDAPRTGGARNARHHPSRVPRPRGRPEGAMAPHPARGRARRARSLAARRRRAQNRAERARRGPGSDESATAVYRYDLSRS